MIHVLGGGLAGVEAAWQAASRGQPVVIHEMRPARQTEIHRTGNLAELVCSNSLRSDKLDNAVGLLKEEMRRLGSLVMRVADEVRVPAGRGARRGPRAIRREGDGGGGRPPAHHHGARGSDRRARSRVGGRPGDRGHRPSDVGGAVGEHRGTRRTPPALLLRRRQPHCPGRLDRSIASLPRVALGEEPGRRGGLPRRGPDTSEGHVTPASSGLVAPASLPAGEGDYLNCPFTREEYEAFYHALSPRSGPSCTTSRRRRSSKGVCRSR